jgi:hypothetical protein
LLASLFATILPSFISSWSAGTPMSPADGGQKLLLHLPRRRFRVGGVMELVVTLPPEFGPAG